MAQAEVRVGDFHIGVRTNAVDVIERVRDVLGHRLVSDPAVRASYAIHVTPGSGERARASYSVYHDCNRVLATWSLDRAIAVVVTRLEHHLPRPVHPIHLLEIDAAAILASEQAVLVPWALPYKAPATELRLQRHDLRVYEGASVWVDAARGELLVPGRRLLEPRGEELLRPQALTEPGRWPLCAWVFLGGAQHAEYGLSRAGALAWALGYTYRHHTLATNLRALSSLLAEMEVTVVRNIDEVPRVARFALGA